MHYFTSDLHIGHNNVIRFSDRPFSDVLEMNNALISNINTTFETSSRKFTVTTSG
ncbi:MAG: hypothetical protein FWG24_05105 [Eggerthellaceae bacterium]|nr:hypothetical protein [Eggerthellaceae bacterium]